MLAVQICIIGRFVKPCENRKNKASLKEAFEEARKYFNSLSGKIVNRTVIQRLMANMLMAEDFTVLLSKTF